MLQKVELLVRSSDREVLPFIGLGLASDLALLAHHHDAATFAEGRIGEHIVVAHGFAHRLRTLDALQLAVALDLRSQGLLEYFVVADQALGEVAAIEGLTVLNPEAL
jgi:hypothetical protein